VHLLSVCAIPPNWFSYIWQAKDVKEKAMKDYNIPHATTSNAATFSRSRQLQLPERVNKLKLESDLTPIPGILKPQHHAADEEPDQS